MSRKVTGAALLLALGGSTLLWGQQTGSQQTETQTQTQVPQHIGAEAPPLTLQSDPEYKNVIVGGVFLGATWDDRGLTRNTKPVTYGGDARFFVQPSVAFQETMPSVSWTLAYTPGASISQHTKSNSQYTQNMAGDLVWTPSARLSVHLRQDYSISDNPFERVGRVPILPELNGYFGPNDSAVLLDQKRTTLVSNAEVSYRLTRHTALGVTGGYQQYEYAGLRDFSSSMLPSHTWTGSLFYSWQASKAQTIGVQYAVTDLFSRPASRVQTHATLLFDTWRLTPHTTLTIYGGPEFSSSHTLQTFDLGMMRLTLPISSDSVNAAGGLTLNWTGVRNAVQFTGARRASDGGGLMSAVTMTKAELAIRRKVARRWSADMRISVADQRALDLFQSQGSYRTYWSGLGLAHEITNNLSARMEYAHVRQTGTAFVGRGDHNLVQFALNWQFKKAIGR